MKYEYGVEYPTNGQKPDLPDDVVIERKFIEGWSKTPSAVGEFGEWKLPIAFRITDERYKPWYESGEVPPLGCEFEAYFKSDDHPEWTKGTTVYLSKEHTILKFDDGYENYYETEDLKRVAKFRPVRTERDMIIKKLRAAEQDVTVLYVDMGEFKIPVVCSVFQAEGSYMTAQFTMHGKPERTSC